MSRQDGVQDRVQGRVVVSPTLAMIYGTQSVSRNLAGVPACLDACATLDIGRDYSVPSRVEFSIVIDKDQKRTVEFSQADIEALLKLKAKPDEMQQKAQELIGFKINLDAFEGAPLLARYEKGTYIDPDTGVQVVGQALALNQGISLDEVSALSFCTVDERKQVLASLLDIDQNRIISNPIVGGNKIKGKLIESSRGSKLEKLDWFNKRKEILDFFEVNGEKEYKQVLQFLNVWHQKIIYQTNNAFIREYKSKLTGPYFYDVTLCPDGMSLDMHYNYLTFRTLYSKPIDLQAESGYITQKISKEGKIFYAGEMKRDEAKIVISKAVDANELQENQKNLLNTDASYTLANIKYWIDDKCGECHIPKPEDDFVEYFVGEKFLVALMDYDVHTGHQALMNEIDTSLKEFGVASASHVKQNHFLMMVINEVVIDAQLACRPSLDEERFRSWFQDYAKRYTSVTRDDSFAQHENVMYELVSAIYQKYHADFLLMVASLESKDGYEDVLKQLSLTWNKEEDWFYELLDIVPQELQNSLKPILGDLFDNLLGRLSAPMLEAMQDYTGFEDKFKITRDVALQAGHEVTGRAGEIAAAKKQLNVMFSEDLRGVTAAHVKTYLNYGNDFIDVLIARDLAPARDKAYFTRHGMYLQQQKLAAVEFLQRNEELGEGSEPEYRKEIEYLRYCDLLVKHNIKLSEEFQSEEFQYECGLNIEEKFKAADRYLSEKINALTEALIPKAEGISDQADDISDQADDVVQEQSDSTARLVKTYLYAQLLCGEDISGIDGDQSFKADISLLAKLTSSRGDKPNDLVVAKRLVSLMSQAAKRKIDSNQARLYLCYQLTCCKKDITTFVSWGECENDFESFKLLLNHSITDTDFSVENYYSLYADLHTIYSEAQLLDDTASDAPTGQDETPLVAYLKYFSIPRSEESPRSEEKIDWKKALIDCQVAQKLVEESAQEVGNQRTAVRSVTGVNLPPGRGQQCIRKLSLSQAIIKLNTEIVANLLDLDFRFIPNQVKEFLQWKISTGQAILKIDWSKKTNTDEITNFHIAKQLLKEEDARPVEKRRFLKAEHDTEAKRLAAAMAYSSNCVARYEAKPAPVECAAGSDEECNKDIRDQVKAMYDRGTNYSMDVHGHREVFKDANIHVEGGLEVQKEAAEGIRLRKKNHISDLLDRFIDTLPDKFKEGDQKITVKTWLMRTFLEKISSQLNPKIKDINFKVAENNTVSFSFGLRRGHNENSTRYHLYFDSASSKVRVKVSHTERKIQKWKVLPGDMIDNDREYPATLLQHHALFFDNDMLVETCDRVLDVELSSISEKPGGLDRVLGLSSQEAVASSSDDDATERALTPGENPLADVGLASVGFVMNEDAFRSTAYRAAVNLQRSLGAYLNQERSASVFDRLRGRNSNRRGISAERRERAQMLLAMADACVAQFEDNGELNGTDAKGYLASFYQVLDEHESVDQHWYNRTDRFGDALRGALKPGLRQQFTTTEAERYRFSAIGSLRVAAEFKKLETRQRHKLTVQLRDDKELLALEDMAGLSSGSSMRGKYEALLTNKVRVGQELVANAINRLWGSEDREQLRKNFSATMTVLEKLKSDNKNVYSQLVPGIRHSSIEDHAILANDLTVLRDYLLELSARDLPQVEVNVCVENIERRFLLISEKSEKDEAIMPQEGLAKIKEKIWSMPAYQHYKLNQLNQSFVELIGLDDRQAITEKYKQLETCLLQLSKFKVAKSEDLVHYGRLLFDIKQLQEVKLSVSTEDTQVGAAGQDRMAQVGAAGQDRMAQVGAQLQKVHGFLAENKFEQAVAMHESLERAIRNVGPVEREAADAASAMPLTAEAIAAAATPPSSPKRSGPSTTDSLSSEASGDEENDTDTVDNVVKRDQAPGKAQTGDGADGASARVLPVQSVLSVNSHQSSDTAATEDKRSAQTVVGNGNNG